MNWYAMHCCLLFSFRSEQKVKEVYGVEPYWVQRSHVQFLGYTRLRIYILIQARLDVVCTEYTT